jgi:hypothetical protein
MIALRLEHYYMPMRERAMLLILASVIAGVRPENLASAKGVVSISRWRMLESRATTGGISLERGEGQRKDRRVSSTT